MYRRGGRPPYAGRYLPRYLTTTTTIGTWKTTAHQNKLSPHKKLRRLINQKPEEFFSLLSFLPFSRFRARLTPIVICCSSPLLSHPSLKRLAQSRRVSIADCFHRCWRDAWVSQFAPLSGQDGTPGNQGNCRKGKHNLIYESTRQSRPQFPGLPSPHQAFFVSFATSPLQPPWRQYLALVLPRLNRTRHTPIRAILAMSPFETASCKRAT